jgi:hypothetical protein
MTATMIPKKTDIQPGDKKELPSQKIKTTQYDLQANKSE